MATLHDTDQRPLQGVVLCCTSLAQDVRTNVADMAIQMGAIHKLDLTADVTHLLVGSITTPKYRYVAKERPDIKVLTPEFIEQVREEWLAGGKVDVKRHEAECKVKTFAGLEMCLTGFNDVAQRADMQMTCQEQGARWSADLTKQVTHLIAAKPEGAKYTHAKQWGIAVVGLKWYEDSLMRGMAVEESYYACEIPREEQGVGAFKTALSKRTSLGKRAREDSQAAAEATEKPGRKRLRKSASMRLGGQSQDLWQSISQHEVQVDNTVVDAWNEMNNESQSLRDSIGSRALPQHSDATEVIERRDPEEPQGLFAGHFVLVHGFDAARTDKLCFVLTSNGAKVVNTPAELENASEEPFLRSRCLLMPHAQPTKLPTVPPGTILVTEWWVERCLHFKQQLDPDQDSLSQPLQDTLITEFKGLVISSTGFNSVDLRMSAETIRLMGATYEEKLTPSTSVLVCASETMKKEKAYYASKHKIPVVRPEWLWESLRIRGKVPTELYSLDLARYDFSQFSPSTGTPAASDTATGRGAVDRVKRVEELVHPKRLSNTRRRQLTPSLMLKPGGSGQPAPAKSRQPPCPFVLEDDDDEGTLSVADDTSLEANAAQASAPLREISPNVSQGSRQTEKPVTKESILDKAQATTKDLSLDEAQPVLPPKSPVKAQNLTSDLAALLHRSRDVSGQELPPQPQKRKQKTLGRNPSGTSLTNLPARQNSTSGSPSIMEEGSEADGFAPSHEPIALPPSTQLEYGNSDVKRVASMGTVKDSEDLMVKNSLAVGAAAAAGGRGKGRARTKA